MPHAQPAPPAATSTTIPPDLPSGYKDPQWERDLDNGKVWKVRDQRNRPLSLRLIRLDADGPMGAKEFRSRDICRKIGPYGDLLDYRDAWVRSPDGELIHESRFSTWEPPTWEGLELFVVMEWTERSLADRLNESKSAADSAAGLPLEDLLELMACVAAGLDDLRGQGVIHTDVSPANLLLIGKQVRVADYGGITSPTRFRSYAKTEPFGIAYYSAPGLELRDPQFGDDQYALAVVYYHLRTNSLPFPGSGPFTAEQARQVHDTDSLQFPAVSPAERKILNRVTLGQKPCDSCQELVDSLRTAAKSGGGISSSVIQLPPPDAVDIPPTDVKSGSSIIAPVVPLPPLVSTESVPPSQLLITTGASTIRSISGKGADSTAEMPALGSLAFSEAELLKIQTQANKFYEALSRGSVENWEPFLAGLDGRLRAAALAELAVTHLAHRWAKGEEPPVEFYLTKYPELGPANRAPAKLILEEHHCKMKAGHPPDLDGIRRRFPHQYEQIEAELQASLNVTPLTGSPASRSGPKATTGSGRSEAVLSVSQEYEFLNVLGRGQFGEVWLARKKGSGIEKAIKILLQNQDHEGAQREQRSLELIKNLRHPYLLATEDFWVSDNRLHIVMELADGSLRSRFKEYRAQQLPGIPEDELLPYIVEAAEGLDFLHSQKVTHRDVKPDNLLLLHGHTKVADFGLAKQQDSSQSTGSLCGTPAYMAPESWGNSSSSASDQYSLAFCYAELRQGKLPISGKLSFQEIMFAHLDGRFDFESTLSPGEQVVLRKAMSRLPADRYKTCMEFVENLGRALGRSVNRKSSRIPKPAPRPIPASQADPAPVPAPLPNSAHQSTLLPPEPGTATFVPGTVVTDAVREAPPSVHTPAAWSVKPGTAPMPALRSSHLKRPRPKRSGAQKVMAGALAMGVLAAAATIVYVVLKPGKKDDVVKSNPDIHGAGRGIGEWTSSVAEAERRLKVNEVEAFAIRNGDLWSQGSAGVLHILPPPVPSAFKRLAAAAAKYVGVELPGIRLRHRIAGETVGRETAIAIPGPRKDPPEIPPGTRYDFIAKLDAVLPKLADGKLPESLGPIAAFIAKGEPPQEADGNERIAFEAVKADLANLCDGGQVRPVTFAGIDCVCVRITTGAPGLMDSPDRGVQDNERVRRFYRAVLPLLLKAFVTAPQKPEWNDAKNWAKLKTSLESVQNVPGLDTTLLKFVLLECELMADPAAGKLGVPESKETDAELVLYQSYLKYAKASADRKGDAKAARAATTELVKVVEAANDKKAPWFQLEARKRIVGRLFLNAEIELLKRGVELDMPFETVSDAGEACRWLKAASTLSSVDDADEFSSQSIARLVIAAAHSQTHRKALVGVAVPKSEEELRKAQLDPEDQIRYWLAYSRTRDPNAVVEISYGYSRVASFVAKDILPGQPAKHIEFAKRFAREQLIDTVAAPAMQHPEKGKAAEPLATLATAFFRRRTLMMPQNWDERTDAVIAADLADLAAKLNPDPKLVSFAGIAGLEAGRHGNLDAKERGAETLVGHANGKPYPLVYLGLVRYLKAGKEPEWNSMVALKTAARQNLTDALESLTDPEDKAALIPLLYRDLAIINMHLGNAVPSDVQLRLEEAADYAKQLTDLMPNEPRAWDVFGCVREDQAWLIRTYLPTRRKVLYRDSVDCFTKAIAGKSDDQHVRFHPMLHRGRCLYRWAHDFPEDRTPESLLSKAEVSLNHICDHGRPSEQLEANYWLAQIEITRAGLNWKKGATNNSPRDLLDANVIQRDPRLSVDSLEKARTHLKAVARVHQSFSVATPFFGIAPPAAGWFQIESATWVACLDCYEAALDNTAANPNRNAALTKALDGIAELAKIDAYAAALLRSDFLHSQLVAVMRWESSKKSEKIDLWKVYAKARPNRDLSVKSVYEARAILKVYLAHYKARHFAVILEQTVELAPEADLREIITFAKSAGLSPSEIAGSLESLAWGLTDDAYKNPDHQLEIAILATHVFLAEQEVDPQLAFLTGAWNPVTAAQFRTTTVSMVISGLTDPSSKTYKFSLALTEKLLTQSEGLLAKQPNQQDKTVASGTAEVKRQRGRLDKLIKP